MNDTTRIIIDLVFIVIILSIYFYTTYQIRMYEKNFEIRCRALYMNVEPEWLVEMKINQSLEETIAKLNVSD